MQKTFLYVAIILTFTLGALILIQKYFSLSSKPTPMPATLQIIADWIDNGYIPARYTCDANDEFPPLTIHNIPADAKSLALIVDDPDAPSGTRDHYLLANIPFVGETTKIIQTTEKDAVVGKNSRGKAARGAPCPPSGAHRYFFKVYAIDQILDIKKGFTKNELLEAMAGHIITQTELIGLYQRK